MTENQKRNFESWDRNMCVVGIARNDAESLASNGIILKQKTKRELQMKVAKAENVHSNQRKRVE